MTIDHEIRVYHDRKREFLGPDNHREGMFIAIQGNRDLGPFRDRDEALEAAYREFGAVPFLVKQILDEEPVYSFARDLG